MSLAVGSPILVTGYGRMREEEERVTFLRKEPGLIVLSFHDSGDDYEVPFEEKSGRIIGATQEAGYEIPAEVLPTLTVWSNPNPPIGEGAGVKQVRTIRRKKSMASNNSEALRKENKAKGKEKPATVSSGEKTPEQIKAAEEFKAKMAAGREKKRLEREAAPPAPVAAKPAGKGKGKTQAAPKPAEAPPVKTETAKPAEKPANPTRSKTTVTAPTEAPKAEDSQPAPKPPSAAPPAPVAVSGGLSPIDAAATVNRKPATGEKTFQITPLLYRQIRWDEIGPYPNGRTVKGFKDFKRSFDSAIERNYVFINVGPAAASYILGTILKNGFDGKWKGSQVSEGSKTINSVVAGIKQGGQRFAEQLAEAFGIEIPKVISAWKPAKDVKADAPKGKPGRPRKNPEAAPAAPTAPTKSGSKVPARTPVKAEEPKKGPTIKRTIKRKK